METFAGLSVLLLILGVVLVICWTILPFAIIGTKPLLREILQEQRETNIHLRRLREQLAPRQPGSPPS